MISRPRLAPSPSSLARSPSPGASLALMICTVMLIGLSAPATAPAAAQTVAPDAPERLEGLPFVVPPFLSMGRANVEINIGDFLLGFLKEASRESDSELARLLEGLESIQVRIADDSSSPLPAAARSEVLALARALEGAGWEPTVRVREEGEDIFIYLQGEGRYATGLVALFVNDSEAGLIHIRGRLDARELGRLAAGLDLPALEDVVRRGNGDRRSPTEDEDNGAPEEGSQGSGEDAGGSR